MMKYLSRRLRRLALLAALPGLLVACGGSGGGAAVGPSPPVSEAVPVEEGEMTQAELRKLDERLVAGLSAGEQPLPIKVLFSATPSDRVLADLLLTRVGGAVVGQVSASALKRIVARVDVEEVEYFSY